MVVPHAAASAAAARHHLAEELLAADLSRALSADAELILTELVTNAIRHAAPLEGSEILLGWEFSGAQLMLWVSDGGSETCSPHARTVGPTATSGRGLAIVSALAERWGVEHEPDRTTVWALVGDPVPSQIAEPA